MGVGWGASVRMGRGAVAAVAVERIEALEVVVGGRVGGKTSLSLFLFYGQDVRMWN